MAEMEQHSMGRAPKYDILSPTFFANPYPTLRLMQQEDPIYWDPILNGWILTRYEDLPRVLRDPRFSSSRVEQYAHGAPAHQQERLKAYNTFVSSWLAFSDPPEHTRLRALISKAMTPQAMEALKPVIQGKIDLLIEEMKKHRSGDFLAHFAEPLPTHVFSVLMGVPVADAYLLKDDMMKIMRLFGAGVASAEEVEHALDAMTNFKKYCHEHITRRRQSPTDDLLSSLIEAREEGSMLSDEEVVGMLITLMIAGYETTANLMTNAVYTLLSHPRELEKLSARPELIHTAVEELLRYEGPTFATFRRATIDTEIRGQRIERDQMVFAFILAANRDPAHFRDADVLDIERGEGKQHLCFSTGIHVCPGAHLARLEAKMAIVSLLAAFPDMALRTTEAQWTPHMMLHGMRELLIDYEPG